ncbi:DUF5924 family protein [Kushneria aurantia]|uniref:DUF5924 family protein n=1 Tax=Kushneria aurantia TaxID=504092 RepID=A0ABV6G3H9_9GAMM|nr:DUF5924 family protein [Kushneria aurantia]
MKTAYQRLLASPRLQRLAALLYRFRWLWPLVSFGGGVISFFLVNRQQSLGAWLALALVASWLLVVLEAGWRWWYRHQGRSEMPRLLANFCAQLAHQETLFFCLPFFLITTVWFSGQALFTGLLVLCAVVSIVDPLYFNLAARRRWLYYAYHAICIFVVVLVIGPLLLGLTTGQSLVAGAVALALAALPTLFLLARRLGPARWLLVPLAAAALGAGSWGLRGWIPPATLWIDASALSPGFDSAARAPRGSMPLSVETLQQRGLYAFTAIHAPLGLNERIFHVWRHNGQEVDRIGLSIHGGRGQGYRAWSRKQQFGDNAAGRWQIDVITDSGQRLGVLRFRVAASGEPTQRADGSRHTTPGVGWLRGNEDIQE